MNKLVEVVENIVVYAGLLLASIILALGVVSLTYLVWILTLP